jgi:hypothetical protein
MVWSHCIIAIIQPAAPKHIVGPYSFVQPGIYNLDQTVSMQVGMLLPNWEWLCIDVYLCGQASQKLSRHKLGCCSLIGNGSALMFAYVVKLLKHPLNASWDVTPSLVMAVYCVFNLLKSGHKLLLQPGWSWLYFAYCSCEISLNAVSAHSIFLCMSDAVTLLHCKMHSSWFQLLYFLIHLSL